MNSYQKLKAENLKLKQHLDIVVNEPDSKDGFAIRTFWVMNRRIKGDVMVGNRTPETQITPSATEPNHPQY